MPYLQTLVLQRDEVPNFSSYPYCLPVVRHLDRISFHPAVTYFVGENGTGKSTLLEAIAIVAGFNAEGGQAEAESFLANGGDIRITSWLGLIQCTGVGDPRSHRPPTFTIQNFVSVSGGIAP